jgi:hypothetical protein
MRMSAILTISAKKRIGAKAKQRRRRSGRNGSRILDVRPSWLDAPPATVPDARFPSLRRKQASGKDTATKGGR